MPFASLLSVTNPYEEPKSLEDEEFMDALDKMNRIVLRNLARRVYIMKDPMAILISDLIFSRYK